MFLRDCWSYSYPQLVPNCGEIRGAVDCRRPKKCAGGVNIIQLGGSGVVISEALGGDVSFWEEGGREWFTLAYVYARLEGERSWLARSTQRRDVRTLTHSPNGTTKTFPCSSVPTNLPALRSFCLSIPTIRGYSSACAVKCWKKRGERMCYKQRLVDAASDQRWFIQNGTYAVKY